MFECLSELIGNTGDNLGNGFITRRQPLGLGFYMMFVKYTAPLLGHFLCTKTTKQVRCWLLCLEASLSAFGPPELRSASDCSCLPHCKALPIMLKHFVAQYALWHCYCESRFAVLC
jgi:hypothetical protein